jgi:hypothetical protein
MSGEIMQITDFFVDFLSREFSPYIGRTVNGRKHINFSAINFREAISEALSKNSLEETHRLKLESLYNEISDDDNPVLLVSGKTE